MKIPRARAIWGGGGGGGSFAGELHLDGHHLKTPDNQIWKCQMVTAFSAFDDWLKGNRDKLARYAAWTRSINCNGWRVFLVWHNLRLKPENDRYYEELRAFLAWCREQGLYIHLVILCDQVDGSAVRMSKGQQIDHLTKVLVIAKEAKNVLTEDFNEHEKNDADHVCGILVASAYDGLMGTRSWWGENRHWNHAGSLLHWTTGHTDRGREWARQFIQALDVMRRGYGLPDGTEVPPTHLPHILGEPRRIAEGSTPRQHADYHAGAKLFGTGGCLHGGFHTIDARHESDLQFCVVPTGDALACCNAVRDMHAAKIWPGNTPDGNYLRGGVDDMNNDNKPDCPIYHRDRYFGGSPIRPAYEEPEGAARTFFIEMGGMYYGLAVDPGPDWRLKVRPGFKLVARGGYDDGVHGPNLLVLQKE